jgi:hypothetical protein
MSLIKPEDLTAFYNHRTARVALILQRELIAHMVEEGAIDEKLADTFYETIDDDSKLINVERE